MSIHKGRQTENKDTDLHNVNHHYIQTALGVLCCFSLFVCLTLLASFFLLISHLKTCTYMAGIQMLKHYCMQLAACSHHMMWCTGTIHDVHDVHVQCV